MKALIERFKNWTAVITSPQFDNLSVDYKKGYADAMSACSGELEAALATGWPWVSVDERLPKPKRICLIAYDEEDIDGIYWARTEDDGNGGLLWIAESSTGAYRRSQPRFWIDMDDVPRPKTN